MELEAEKSVNSLSVETIISGVRYYEHHQEERTDSKLTVSGTSITVPSITISFPSSKRRLVNGKLITSEGN